MSTTLDEATIGPSQAMATRVGFFIAGFGMAAWAPLIVFAKSRVGLDDGQLGLLLLGLGCGSIVAMPLAGALAARFGCRAVIVLATIVICLTLPGLATIADPVWLGLTLLLFGAGVGSVDCVINLHAVIVERALARPLMSGFHGLFSVGGIVGAGGVSLLLGLGLTPIMAILVVVACMAAALAVAAPGLLTSGGAGSSGPAFALPHGIVLLIGILCFVVFLTEGAMLDWSGVFLKQGRGVEPARAGLGYAFFAATMTAGRLSGDWIVKQLGGTRIVALGAFLAALGLAVAVLVPGWAAALVGFAIVGAGCSNVVPVLYTAVGRQTAMPEHIAVPAISTLGYAGILAGPALIGGMAHLTTLGVAFLIVAVCLLGVSACSRLLR